MVVRDRSAPLRLTDLPCPQRRELDKALSDDGRAVSDVAADRRHRLPC